MIKLFYSQKKQKTYALVPVLTDYTYLKPYHTSHYHLHPVYHMVFIQKGQVQALLETSSVALKEKDILLINPMEKHIFKTGAMDVKYFAFNFILIPLDSHALPLNMIIERMTKGSIDSTDGLKDLLAECDSLCTILDIEVVDSKVQYPDVKWPRVLEEINHFYQQINGDINDFRINRSNAGVVTHYLNCSYDFLSRIFSKYLCPETLTTQISQENHDQLMTLIDDYLHNHLSDKLDLKELAKELDYNPSYLCQYFRQKHGATLSTYFDRLKIQKACEYLRYTNKSITEIGYLLGYSSSQHFSKNFKKEKSISPLSYRKNIEMY